MKLYVYIYDYLYQTKVTLQIVEAEEKPKTYQLINGSVSFKKRLLKNEIGVLIRDYGTATVVFEERDDDKALSFFKSMCDAHIDKEQEAITASKSRIIMWNDRKTELSDTSINVEGC